MDNEALLKIFNSLFAYFSEHKVVSEDELALKITESINLLSKEEIEELKERWGENLKELVFKSITTDEKISVFSPDLHVRINYQGEIFFCPPTHRYMSEELEKAFIRLTKIRNPLKEIKRVVEEFMRKSGYQTELVKENEYMEIRANKGVKTFHLFLFSSIKFVPYFRRECAEVEQEKEGEEKAIVVPTERTPMPFISFFREQDAGNFMIWIANVEKNTIDPFIGNLTDEDIEKNFSNPEQARRAVGIWMRKIQFMDL